MMEPHLLKNIQGTSSGTTTSPERYTLPTGTEGRYIRITVNGNTQNEWASITEISVLGQTGSSSTNRQPTADSKSVTTSTNTPVDITLSGNDPDNDPITFNIVDQPLHGQPSSISSQNVVKYTPAAGYNGPDSFTYIARDNKGATSINKATVSITVSSH